jgi:hypothetical protein
LLSYASALGFVAVLAIVTSPFPSKSLSSESNLNASILAAALIAMPRGLKTGVDSAREHARKRLLEEGHPLHLNN